MRTSITTGSPARWSGAAGRICGCTPRPTSTGPSTPIPTARSTAGASCSLITASIGDTLTAASTGLRDWIPVMPSIGQPTTRVHGGEKFDAGGRSWEILHTPGHSPGHICIWSAGDRLLCSGDHLLKSISPPVTFERGFERDPMGSYLESLRLVELLEPALVLPGHGETFTDGAARAASIAEGKRRRLGRVLASIESGRRTVTELATRAVPEAAQGRAAALRHGRDSRLPRLSGGTRPSRAGAGVRRGLRLARSPGLSSSRAMVRMAGMHRNQGTNYRSGMTNRDAGRASRAGRLGASPRNRLAG